MKTSSKIKTLETVQCVIVALAFVVMFCLGGGADHVEVAFSTTAGAVALTFVAALVSLALVEMLKSYAQKRHVRYKKTREFKKAVKTFRR